MKIFTVTFGGAHIQVCIGLSTRVYRNSAITYTHTPCLKKVAHHTLRNIFAQGWPIAKISTATESEIICEHKFVINVLIFNVPKCCHLMN